MTPCLEIQTLGLPFCSNPLTGALQLHSVDENIQSLGPFYFLQGQYFHFIWLCKDLKWEDGT